MLSAKEMLDNLMGKDRDLTKEDKAKIKPDHYSESKFCRTFLVLGMCPHNMFLNTKLDLGPCAKIHDDHQRLMFTEDRKSRKYGFEEEALRKIETLVSEMDRKVVRSKKERLQDNENIVDPESLLTESEKAKSDALTKELQEVLKAVETLGEEGKVEEADSLMKTAEEIKAKKQEIINASSLASAAQNEKRMEVCDICGALLVIGDTEQRVKAHLEGKVHVGYSILREKISELKKIVDEKPADYRSRRNDRDRDERPGEEDRSRSRTRRDDRREDRRDDRSHRDRHRDRDHNRSRSRRDRERDRGDSKYRPRSRSRSRSR